jgi:transcriptional regulator with XRE-family HTH domain
MELREALHEDVEAHGVLIGEAIRRMRKSMGLKQDEFGRLFKLTKRQIYELETGKANPTLELLMRMGGRFGFNVGFIIGKGEKT